MKQRQLLYDYYLQKLPRPYRSLMNKFTVATVLFCIWILFFARANIITQIRLDHSLNNLKNQKRYYEQNIEQVKAEQKQLFTTDANFEKFARERHLMKRKNEDIFILEDEE